MLVREVVIFAELKVPPNKLTAEQEEWVRRLRAAGAAACVWTPDDWGEIDKTLRGA